MKSNNRITRRWSSIEVMAGPPSTSAAAEAAAEPSPNNRVNKTVIHDTELVAAIKHNEVQPSHKWDIARLERHAEDTQGGRSVYEDQMRETLSNAVFVGHINTDLDSVAGAMGAAALFGGTPALAEPYDTLNGEITFALQNCGLEPPKHFEALDQSKDCDVCLVDHTEEKQMVPTLRDSPNRTNRIVGVIDHHALAKSFSSTRPLFMDLRPWGSMSTIVGYLFISYRRALPKPLAVLLLQAILSDTLNLRSVTTTDADRSMVALLVSYGGIGKATQNQLTPHIANESKKGNLYEDTDIDSLAKKQFQAKTNWIVALGPYEMVRGDQKDFASGPWKFGISVLEVTDTTAVMKIAQEILLELRLLKKEKGLVNTDKDIEESNTVLLDRTLELDFAFLFVVNVVEQKSILLISGGRELALAKAAFIEDIEINPDNSVILQEAFPGIRAPGSTIRSDETAMILPTGYVSRKAQFVPAFFKAIQDDFEYEEKGPVSRETHQSEELTELRGAQVKEAIELRKNPPPQPSRPNLAGRRQSSLLHCLESIDIEDVLAREAENDEELVRVNELTSKEHHGNLYDSKGRVIRTYV